MQLSINDAMSWGLFLLAYTGAVAGFWKFLTKMEANLSEKLEKHRDEIDDKHNDYMRTVGEGMTAIRTKISDVELYARDTFMRRDNFLEASQQMREEHREAMSRIERWMERVEQKIDNRQ